ncbi:MAG: hypothetical protein EOO28_07370 [Comamonadaceae bacterium]|nr:MAG: hypothetical protein EOO28_07370 [Comamonadaceae bacterium]
MSSLKKYAPLLVALLAALLLSACGGDDDAPAAAGTAVVLPGVPPPDMPVLPGEPAGPGGEPPVVVGSATGILTDSPIGGVKFSTSSGVTGTTDAEGAFKYNPGDTVTFTLGALTLGTVTATSAVTPFELAEGSDVKLQNLLVLLQSLDNDGDAENGIAIPAAAASALTSSIDLQAVTATFASSANTALQQAMTAGGIATPIKTTAQANTHFINQGLAQLTRYLWVSRRVGEAGLPGMALLYFTAGGDYGSPADGAYPNGDWFAEKESGNYVVNGFSAYGFDVRRVTSAATPVNPVGGLSALPACGRLHVRGEVLVVGGCGEPRLYVRMDNEPAGLVGAWGIDGMPYLMLFADGKLFAIGQNVGSGSYVRSGSALTMTFDGHRFPDGSISQPIILVDTYEVSADGAVLNITPDFPGLTRLSR